MTNRHSPAWPHASAQGAESETLARLAQRWYCQPKYAEPWGERAVKSLQLYSK